MAVKKIGDYGVIGNGAAAALVGRDGAIDWLCLPQIDSESVFAALLDPQRGGAFTVEPPGRWQEDWDTAQSYIEGTNVLRTRFRTRGGEVELTDFMPIGSSSENTIPYLVRRITGIHGDTRLRITVSARLRYARVAVTWQQQTACAWSLHGDDGTYSITTSSPVHWHEDQTSVAIGAGETFWIAFGAEQQRSTTADIEAHLNTTIDYWRRWISHRHPDDRRAHSTWRQQLVRSDLLLALLQSPATGAIYSAITASIPRTLYGMRACDGRYEDVFACALYVEALLGFGHVDAAQQYLLHAIARLPSPRTLLHAPRSVALDHLSGYRGTPAAVQSEAVAQCDYTTVGFLLDAALLLSRHGVPIERSLWEQLQPLVDFAAQTWPHPDLGYATSSLGPRHFTLSKLLWWMALDRGVKLAQRYGYPGDVDWWKEQRQAVRDTIITQSYRADKGLFAMHPDSDEIDPALLLLPITGFLPADDPRVKRTLAAIELVVRGAQESNRSSEEVDVAVEPHFHNLFPYWHVNCLILQQRFDDAEERLRLLHTTSNHLGLFGEHFDGLFREINGNFPAGRVHAAYAVTVMNFFNGLNRLQRSEPPAPERRLGMVFRSHLLNPVSDQTNGSALSPSHDADQMLQQALNELRREFYDAHEQTLEYARIRGTQSYQRFRDAITALREFDPLVLESDAHRLVFWLNVFNAAVIHGIVELGLTRSVRDVPLFFDRIQYKIGRFLFTPSDIEHGILRANAPPPGKRRNKFIQKDPRCRLGPGSCDLRVHFAMFRGTRSAPYLDVYILDRLESMLNDAARVSVNAAAQVVKKKRTLLLPEQIAWYRQDFPQENTQFVSYLSRFFNDPEVVEWLGENAHRVNIEYQSFDWRLNS